MAILTGANRNDVTQLIPLIEAIAPIKGVRGRPLSRPKRVMRIEATITTSTGASCTSEAFPPALPDADNHTAAGLGRFDGSLSARMPGCTTFDVSVR